MYNKQHMRRGFTLIELMVIVAIIGLFSALALASLGRSKNKGSDAAVQQDMRSIQQQAELYSIKNANSYGSTYGTACDTANTVFDGPKVQKLIEALEKANGGSGTITCHNTTSQYVVVSSLPAGGYWCVDSSGYSGSKPSPLGSSELSCK